MIGRFCCTRRRKGRSRSRQSDKAGTGPEKVNKIRPLVKIVDGRVR